MNLFITLLKEYFSRSGATAPRLRLSVRFAPLRRCVRAQPLAPRLRLLSVRFAPLRRCVRDQPLAPRLRLLSVRFAPLRERSTVSAAEAVIVSEDHGLRAGPDAEFVEDVRHVIAHGLLADRKTRR